jgi:hypothetical protein
MSVQLSFGQRIVLFAQRSEDRGWLNLRFCARLDPPPSSDGDVRRLLQFLQQRHDAFRARLLSRGGLTVDFADPADAPPIELLTAPPRGFDTWASQPFDQRTGPLVRARLESGAASATLHLVLDHLVFDGWSFDVLARDVQGLWRSITDGAPLPQAPGSFEAYLEHQRSRATGESLERYRHFWRHQLANHSSIPLPQTGAADGCEELVFAIPAAITTSLEAVRRKLNATDFCIYLAALATALLRDRDQRSLVVFTNVADRERPEDLDTIGCLLNHVGIRIDVARAFEATVECCRDGLINALLHQTGPFFEIGAPLRQQGAIVSAQPHLFRRAIWHPSADEADRRLVRPSPPPPLADIDFTFKPEPWGTVAAIRYRTRYLTSADAVELGARFVDELTRGLCAGGPRD